MSLQQSRGYYIRSPLARAVYSRIVEDQFERAQDHSHWYFVDKDCLSSELEQRFVQFNEDEETKLFLESCSEKSDWLFMQLYQSLFKFILSWVMNNTSINGLLRRGSMFVLSQKQFHCILSIDEANWKRGRLLDLGAGDGMVTKQMAPYFDEVFVTELSTTMRWRLQEHRFKVLEVNEWFQNTTAKYDVISCLNLLDRCDRPIELLEQIRSMLRPGSGRLLLAVVMPFSPYVEMGVDGHQPKQFLNIRGSTFEEQVQSLVQDVLNPLGFQVERFSRLPYLCEGDLHHSFYQLSDAVFALKVNQ